MNKLQVHGGSLGDMGQRFVDAWHRAERGEAIGDGTGETHVTFLDLERMQSTLSPRRLELLRHVRQHGATHTREPATALARNYKNVHQDVAALEAAGLLLRDGRRLAVSRDEAQASAALARAAGAKSATK